MILRAAGYFWFKPHLVNHLFHISPFNFFSEWLSAKEACTNYVKGLGGGRGLAKKVTVDDRGGGGGRLNDVVFL